MAVCQLHNPQGIVGMHDLVDDPWLQLSKKLASEAKWRETINSVYSWTNIILNSIDSHFGSKCMYIGKLDVCKTGLKCIWNLVSDIAVKVTTFLFIETNLSSI